MEKKIQNSSKKFHEDLRQKLLEQLQADETLSNQLRELFDIADEIKDYFNNPPSYEVRNYIEEAQLREKFNEACIGKTALLNILLKYKRHSELIVVQGFLSAHLLAKKDIVEEIKNKVRYSTDKEVLCFIPKQYSNQKAEKLKSELVNFISPLHSNPEIVNSLLGVDSKRIVVVDKLKDIEEVGTDPELLVIAKQSFKGSLVKRTPFGNSFSPVEEHMKCNQMLLSNKRQQNAENVRRAEQKKQRQEKLLKHVFAIMREQQLTTYEQIAYALIDRNIKAYRDMQEDTLRNFIGESLNKLGKKDEYNRLKASIKESKQDLNVT